MTTKAERQRQSAEALQKQRAEELEHVNQMRSEWNSLDGDIYMLSLDASTDFEKRTAMILRNLYSYLETTRA